MNKKIVKIITLILSCLLLIGAAVGITVSAAETETTNPQIFKRTLSYEGAVKIAYLVQADLAEGQSIKVVFGDASKIEENKKLEACTLEETESGYYYIKGVAHTSSFGGVEYPLVYSKGIAAKEYRLDVIATPVIVDAEGTVVSKGDSDTFSPYAYAMARFNGSPSPDQYNLYTSLLDYSAAVQTVLGYTESNISKLGGWADEYYVYTLDGEKVVKRGNATDAGTVTADRFKNENGVELGFKGWTDGNGKPIVGWTTLKINPGDKTELKKVYGSVNTNVLKYENNTLTGKEIHAGSYSTISPENKAITFNHAGNVGGSSILFASANPGVYAERYVYETDFMINSWDATATAWVAKFIFTSNNSNLGAGEIANLTIAPTGEKDKSGYYTKANCNNNAIIDLDTWNHVAMVVEIATDGTVKCTASINGGTPFGIGYQRSLKAYGDYKVTGAGMQLRGAGTADDKNTMSEINMSFNNVECYTEGNPVSYDVTLNAAGGTSDATYKVTMGEKYNLSATRENYKLVCWKYTALVYDSKDGSYDEKEIEVPISGTWSEVPYRSEDSNEIVGRVPTLTAVWTPLANISLNTNGGKVDNFEIYEDMPYELPTPTNGSLIFTGWVDAEGNSIPTEGAEWTYGDITLTAKWNSEINYADLADQIDHAGAPSTGTINFNTPGYSSSAVDAAGKMYIFKTTYTFKGVTDCFTGTGAAGDAYVKAYNLAPIYVKLQQGTTDATNLWASQASVGGTIYTKNADGEFVPTNNGVLPEGCTGAYLSTLSWGGVTYQIGEEYDIEWVIVMNGEDNAPTSVFTATKKSDGSVQTGNMSLSYQANINQFHWEFRGAGAAGGDFSMTESFTNTSWSVSVPAVAVNVTLDAQGGVLAGASEFSTLTGSDYDITPPTYEGLTFAGWYNGNTPVGNTGKWPVTMSGDVTLTAKWTAELAGVYNDFNDGSKTAVNFGTVTNGKLTATFGGWAQAGFAVTPTSAVSTGNANGTTYIFSAKFTYEGGAKYYDSNDAGTAWIGFSNVKDVYGNSGMAYAYYLTAGDNSGDAAYINLFGQKFYKGVEYEVRFEQVVGTKGVRVYVNGEYMGTDTATSATTASDQGTFFGFVMYTRASGLKLTFDDVYVGVQGEATKVNYTLDPTHGTLPEGAITSGSIMVGSASALPTPSCDGYKFGGWYVGNDPAVVDGKISAVVTEGATITAKWVVSENKNLGSVANSTGNYSGGGTNTFTYVSSKPSDAIGTKYIYTVDYIYEGLSAFNVADGVASALAATQVGYYRINGYDAAGGTSNVYMSYTDDHGLAGANDYNNKSKWVQADGITAAVDANGNVVTVDGAALTHDQIFFKEYTWWGLVFEMNQEYAVEFVITLTESGTTAVVSATNKTTGEIQTRTLGYNRNNMMYFRQIAFSMRGSNSGITHYTISQSFLNNNIEIQKAAPEHVASEVVAPEFIKN